MADCFEIARPAEKTSGTSPMRRPREKSHHHRPAEAVCARGPVNQRLIAGHTLMFLCEVKKKKFLTPSAAVKKEREKRK